MKLQTYGIVIDRPVAWLQTTSFSSRQTRIILYKGLKLIVHRVVETHLLELDDVPVHDLGAVGAEHEDGAHDEDDVLVAAPARLERADELRERVVDVALGQLQHVRVDLAELLLAVRDLGTPALGSVEIAIDSKDRKKE